MISAAGPPIIVFLVYMLGFLTSFILIRFRWEFAFSLVPLLISACLYIICVCSSPGFPDLKQLEAATALKKNGKKRFCGKCNLFKPDRTHHCRKCGKCVLKMDHHCPWIVNCVGKSNYKTFLLFLFYTLLSSVALSACSLNYLLYSEKFFYFVLVQVVIAIFCGICVSGLLGFHIVLLSRNQTTIERLEKQTLDFNLGCLKNWKQVLGPFYLWLVPIKPK